MKQYFAVSTNEDMRAMPYLSHKNILISFFYWKGKFKETFQAMRPQLGDFFMDSGAFSFMNSGKTVNITEYIQCIKEDHIQKYSALDVIGDPKGTKDNFLIMKKQGLDPIPTFHINTDESYLYYYLEHSRHLAIGGMVSGDRIVPNLDRIWNIIMQRNPDIQVHGFGVTNVDIGIRYPWHSIDGSSFNQVVKFSRALEWGGKAFNIIDTKVFLEKMGYTIEGTSLGNVRHLLLFWQMEQYNRMIDYINEVHRTKDFSYLTSQQTLF